MTVYANGLEVSCKAQGDKVIAAFPDVCFTPPENPATPPGVPIPYPTFGFDSDTDKGTGTVKIGDETISQKNKSYYTKTTGTEAGCAAKKGVINSKNTGKKYCRAWSSNVKADKEPITRFSDITTNNHASTDPPNAPTPQPQVGGAGPGGEADTECPPIGPYDQIECDSGSHKHHIVPDMCYRLSSRRARPRVAIPNAPTLEQGICICLTEDQHSGLHSGLNQQLNQMGQVPRAAGGLASGATTVTQTAPLEDCVDASIASIAAIPDLHPDCVARAAKEVADQASPAIAANQPGRASTRLPNADAHQVLFRGHY